MSNDWNEVRQRLVMFPELYLKPRQLLELVDKCAQSAVLLPLIPILSLSRLCICRYIGDINGPCLFYKNGKFVVSTFNSQGNHLFDDLDQLLHFVETSLSTDNS